jgi:3-deoxy-D-manno-octulosonate 8-phosphate phosphatase (KDO 8-P phosphatase)
VPAEIDRRAARARLILFDVDGVLTDGTLLMHGDGGESKRYDIKDGTGIVLAQRAGIRIGFLSARMSPATQQRAMQLGHARASGHREQAGDLRADRR